MKGENKQRDDASVRNLKRCIKIRCSQYDGTNITEAEIQRWNRRGNS